MSRGKLIALEGPDGSGKTTQARLLSAWLRRLALDVVETREPGGTPFAEAIRAAVLGGAEADPVAVMLAFQAARADHVSRLIRPALDAGKWVVCDRFTLSTVAYQGVGQGIDEDAIVVATNLSTRGLRPDLTVVLDVPVDVSLARIASKNPDRFEAMDRAFHERVREAYLIAARRSIPIINATLDVDSVAAMVRTVVAERFAL